MNEIEFMLQIEAQAIKRVQIHYAVMAKGYMVIADGKALKRPSATRANSKRWMPQRDFCSSSA